MLQKIPGGLLPWIKQRSGVQIYKERWQLYTSSDETEEEDDKFVFVIKEIPWESEELKEIKI